MDEGKRLSTSSRGASAWSDDTSARSWHSTPVKMKNYGDSLDANRPSALSSFKMDGIAKQWGKSTPPIPADAELPVSDPSGSTVQRQRKELQLLMAELKDRDSELNTMAASHHKQLHAWDRDRQKVLLLEQRCARLDEELRKRNEVIRVLTKHVSAVETRKEDVHKELAAAQQLLCDLEEKRQDVSHKCQDFEEKNQSLNSTVMALSSQVGSLQVREEELSSMLKLKDKDVAEASGHVRDLTGRVRHLEATVTESRSRESELMRDSEENKRRHRESRYEITHLKEELQQQVSQSSTQREEVIRLKQELQLLRRDLALSGEGDGWKDELLELARSKQERTASELRCLRQVCENQRSDLQLLQLSLDSAREKSGQATPDSRDEFRCVCPDRLSRGSRLSRDSVSPPAANQQRPVDAQPGVFSERSIDGEDPLSSCFLQQLLDESRQLVRSELSSSVHVHGTGSPTGTCGPFHSHRCQTSLHNHLQTTSISKDGDTPAAAGPRQKSASWMA
ncbi:coiled-coil domain-containing protein 62 [Clinocottus analis]|uniref:coiled-coil domain-containing protein 62 n=1 Tax=Clinocottus analis TaxID=304258 RepID=UPI0035BFA86E